MLKVKGKGASPGTALGTAFVLKSRDFHFSELKNYESGRELLRWKTAHAALLIELKSLKEKFETDAPVETRQVIEAHQMMAEDPEWTSQIEAFISQGHQCEYAVHKASEDFAQMIEALDDPYLRQRAQDIRDVAKRVFEALDSQVNQSASKNEDYILVAEDLLPSDLLSLYSKHLKAESVLTKRPAGLACRPSLESNLKTFTTCISEDNPRLEVPNWQFPRRP